MIPKLPGHFREVIKRAHQEPVKKFTTPQTESQEYGWLTAPLVSLPNYPQVPRLARQCINLKNLRITFSNTIIYLK